MKRAILGKDTNVADETTSVATETSQALERVTLLPDVAVVVPMPGLGTPGSAHRTGVNIGKLINDEKSLAKMFQTVVERSGLTKTEICKRLDIRENGFRDYFTGKRKRPSLWWFIRLCDVCGAEITVHFPRPRD